jgi:MFS family permease
VFIQKRVSMYNRAVSNRLFYILFVSQSLFAAAQIAVGTLTAIVAVRLSGTESVAGVPSSTQTFSQALTAYPMAIVLAYFGRRIGLSLGYATAALGGIVGVWGIVQGNFPLLLVSAALIGTGRASGEQARFVVGEIFPEGERARMIGRLVFAGTVGAVFGPLLVAPSGRLMESLGVHPDVGPWLGLSILCALAALINFFLLRPEPATLAANANQNSQDSQDKQKNEPVQPVRPLMVLFMLPKVQLAVLAVLISQTVMVVLMVMTPLHMHHNHHDRDMIALVIAAHTLGMFGLSPVTGYLIDRLGRIPMLSVGALTMAASALLAPVSTHEAILIVALFLLGLGWNFGYVAGSSLLADTLQGEERARVQGVNDSLVYFVAGLGSLGAGPLFAAGGYTGVSMIALLIVVALLGLIFWLNRPSVGSESESESAATKAFID